MEFFSARLGLRVNEPKSVLSMEFFSWRPEAMVIEPAGFRVQVVGTPTRSVQVTAVVVEA